MGNKFEGLADQRPLSGRGALSQPLAYLILFSELGVGVAKGRETFAFISPQCPPPSCHAYPIPDEFPLEDKAPLRDGRIAKYLRKKWREE